MRKILLIVVTFLLLCLGSCSDENLGKFKLIRTKKETYEAQVIKICKEMEMAMKKNRSIFSITNYMGDKVIYFDGRTDMFFPLTNITKLKELNAKFDYEYFFKYITNREIFVNGYGNVSTGIGIFKYDAKNKKWFLDEFSFVAEESVEE